MLIIGSLLLNSISLFAKENSTIITPFSLPKLEDARDFVKNEVIVIFKKDIEILKKNKEFSSSFINDMNEIIANHRGNFKSNFKEKNTIKFNKNYFKTQNFKNLNAMHIKAKENSTQELIEYFHSKKMKKYVESVSANNIFIPTGTTDNQYDKLWAIENRGQDIQGTVGKVNADMDILEAWEKTKGDSNVIVAILDTGVDYTHSDLQDNMWNGAVNHGYDFAGDNDGNNDDDPMPDAPYDENGHYHGTHVAGIIGAVGDNSNGISGVAQHISMMALKIFRPNGYGYTSDVLEALDYISTKIDEGENIVAVNGSFGGIDGTQDDAVNHAIKQLGEKGVIFSISAGNNSQNIDITPAYPASYDAKNIITVASSNQNDKLEKSSNYGAKSVDVVAPGTNILSTFPNNQYAYLSGTSMASPQITGAIALIASLYPASTVAERKAMILNSVDKKDAFIAKVITEGRVNINNALNNENLIEENIILYENGYEDVKRDSFNYSTSDEEGTTEATVVVKVKEEEAKKIELPIFENITSLDRWRHLDLENNPIKYITTENKKIEIRSNEEEELTGKIEGEEKKSTLVLNVPNRDLKLNDKGNTLINFEKEKVSIEIDSKGNIKVNFSKLKNAILPKDGFPLGTDLKMNQKRIKVTLSLSKSIRF